MPGLLGDIGRTLGGYVAGQVKVSLILSLLYAVGYALAGVPFWPVFAMLTGFLNMVPVFGAVAGMLLTAAATALAGRDLLRVLMVPLVFAVVQGLEGFLITPRVIGKRVQLSPLTVFVVVTAGGMLFGFIGLLLAVPVAAVAALVWKHLQSRR